jgi:hypothetical protein
MVVDNDGDIMLAKPVNKRVNLVEVLLVIDPGGLLNSFPHNAQSDDSDAPLDHLGHVLVGHAGAVVESLLSWQIGRQLDHDIGAVEDPSAAILVSKGASVGVNGVWRRRVGEDCANGCQEQR